MYSELRVMMAELLADINVEFFGPAATTIINSKTKSVTGRYY